MEFAREIASQADIQMEVLPHVLNPLFIGDSAPFDPLLIAHGRAPRQKPFTDEER